MQPLPPASEIPLLRRFPALADLPRARFGTFPTPVHRIDLDGERYVLIKRDDLSGTVIGGNKVRALEWLLGRVKSGTHVLTVGPKGTTHGLTTMLCAKSLGASTTVVRWRQVMNDAARRVDARMRLAGNAPSVFLVSAAYALARIWRLRPRTLWIPAGAATPHAVLGHVNAALELVEQVARRECALPNVVVVPFGTGGTAAGLALGFRLAGVSTRVVGVRVVPRSLGRPKRAWRLANKTARLIEKTCGTKLPRIGEMDLTVEHGFYGGKYGRPLKTRDEAERALGLLGIRLDDTYSRKAFSAAMSLARSTGDRVMLWLTFDGRLLT